MPISKKTVPVSFEDLNIDDIVIIQDRNHNAHGATGTVYHLDNITKFVSVVTKNAVDTWEGYADGLLKVI